MSVAISPGFASPPAHPTPLFQAAVYGGGSVNNWYRDVTPDGQRFLINTVVAGNTPRR